MIKMPELLSSEVVTSAGIHCKKPTIIILHTWKFTGTDTTLLEYNYSLPQVNNSVNES